MDINPFEAIGKTVRRTYEAAEDTYMHVENAFCDTFMGFIAPKGDYAKYQSAKILDSAEAALRHEDIAEARHQLERDIYFSSINDDLLGSPFNDAAHAGLEALKQNKTPPEIRAEMKEAFDKSLLKM